MFLDSLKFRVTSGRTNINDVHRRSRTINFLSSSVNHSITLDLKRRGEGNTC